LHTLADLGISAKLINHNTFVDERAYRIDDGVQQSYDAVYNARLVPFKRHFLATGVTSLLLLAAGDPTPDEVAAVRKILPEAEIANTRDGAYRDFDLKEVVRELNTARCGLCLSAIEGAMFSSIEYLLCGLPVVNTPNAGGRDWFFSTDYVFDCEDNPQSVARAVTSAAALGRIGSFRQFVRNSTIRRIRQEREKFYSIINDIFVQSGQPGRRIQDEIGTMFADKLNYVGRPLGQFLVP
jgi:hypothetical protein